MTYPGIEHDQALLSGNPDMAAVEARRAEREEEYGVYVATQAIDWGTVRAFNPGDPIPKDTVERLHWTDMGLAAKRTTKEGRRVIEESGTLRPGEAERWAEEDKAAAAKAKAAEEAKPQAAPAAKASDKKGGAN